jgi:hypothetical protein
MGRMACTEPQCLYKGALYILFENYAIYEIMWKNILEPERPQMMVCHMCNACWIPKATSAHSEYVIHTAFPPQRWLHERT